MTLVSACVQNNLPKDFAQVERLPQIFPDYTNLTIPYNIAPLNFSIKEAGDQFAVRIASEHGKEITIASSTPEIQINQSKWKKLLSENKDEVLHVDVFCNKGGSWTKYQTINHKITKDNIDSHLTYRLINSAYVLWFEMGIYQRNLESFEESTIIHNKSLGGACINCHYPNRNDPTKSFFHIRAKHSGTVILKDDKLEKVETKTDYTLASAAYASWHPNGRHIAFSVNKINQNFHVFKDKSNEVSDKYSDLIIYDTETRVITTSPKVSTRNRENLPEWSADGKHLYYISAKEAVDDSARMIAKYSLVKIPYDVSKNLWGEPDTVLSANTFGKSISFPRASPDGKHLVFCATDYGYFTIHHKISDLYIMNLETGKYRLAKELNSEETESYHSWSSNGRWLIFSSRRIDGVHTRPFIAYVDEQGNCSKPFVVPQKDPNFYTSYLLNYNRPELMTGKIDIAPQAIRDVAREASIPVTFDPLVDVDALSGASKIRKKDE